jgi:hypothetical protein
MRTSLFLVAAIAIAVRLPAQGSAPSPIVEYRPMRFEEDWSRNGGDAFDSALKHRSLLPGDWANLTIAGSARWREEFDRNYLFASTPAAQDQFGIGRVMVSADLRVGHGRPYARAFVEYKHADGFNRTLPGGVRPTERDLHDIENVFAEVGWGNALLVRVGRQDVALGRERLVGLSDWTNTRRAFQGIRVRALVAGLAVDALASNVVVVRPDLPDLPDTTSRFNFVAVGSPAVRKATLTVAPAQWQAYVLRSEAAIGAPAHRTTTGVRAEWRAPVIGGATLIVEGEGATQRGTQNSTTTPLAIRAWMIATEAQLVWASLPWRPAIIAGDDRASGDHNATDGIAGAFAPPYATAHAHNGMADAFGRGNLDERRIGAAIEPRSWWRLTWTARNFSRLDLADGIYSKQNTIFRAASGSTAREVGVEHDVETTLRVGRHLRLSGGVGAVTAGAFVRETAGGAAAYRFAYLSSAILF